MRALFDVNVLVAMFDAQHLHHTRVLHWWLQNRAHGWASCPLTQNGFLRVISQPSYAFPVSIADAFEYLRRNVQTDEHAFWPDDVSLLDERTVSREHVLGPKQLIDVYLLALAVKHGGRLATFDRGVAIAAIRKAEPRHLVVL
jgi:toxin-antitoxin system PIN domain toxin